MNTAEKRICCFVRGLELDNIPSPVLNTALRCLTDTVGVMLSGTRSFQYRAALNSLRADSFASEQTISLSDAALLGGVCAHSQEYNDLFYCQPGHPSACLVPVALGLGERLDSSGRQLM